MQRGYKKKKNSPAQTLHDLFLVKKKAWKDDMDK